MLSSSTSRPSRAFLFHVLAVCTTALSTLHGLEPVQSRPVDSRSVDSERSLPSLQEEQASLDTWLAQADTVERGRQSDRIFAFADRLLASGAVDKALRYLEIGLQANAWDLERQLKYGELLGQKGQESALRERAELVLRHAETDVLLQRASEFLKREALPPILPLGREESNDPVLILVPLGEVSRFALADLREALRSKLGISVEIRAASVKLPPASREQKTLWITQTRSKLVQQLDATPALGGLLAKAGITRDAIQADDQAVVSAVRWIIASEQGEAAIKDFDQTLRQWEAAKQWETGKLLKILESAAQPYQRPGLLILGVTDLDLYSGNSNFLFGSAFTGKGIGIMSLHRFLAAFNSEPPRRSRLVERGSKQALSSVGFMLGVDRCTTPECARAYPRSLAEHDQKPATLCESCRAGFEAKLKRSLPRGQ